MLSLVGCLSFTRTPSFILSQTLCDLDMITLTHVSEGFFQIFMPVNSTSIIKIFLPLWPMQVYSNLQITGRPSYYPPSVSANAAALISLSRVFAAPPSACSGNFNLKWFRQDRASWNQCNSYKQRA